MWLCGRKFNDIAPGGVRNRTYKGCFPASPFFTTISTTERWSRVNASSPKANWPVKINNQIENEGCPIETELTDVLSSILDLRKHGWDLWKVESFRVEHGVIGSIVHGIEGNFELNNLVWGR